MHCFSHGAVELGWISNGVAPNQMHARRFKLVFGFAKEILPFPRMRVDDENGFAGDWSGGLHSPTTREKVKSAHSSLQQGRGALSGWT